MLKGKILQIQNKEYGFVVKIDRSKKTFTSLEEMENWILQAIIKGQDKTKVKLLREDCRYFLKLPPENP